MLWNKVIGATAAAASNLFGPRGVFGGGLNSSAARVNTIDYITIATTGNATDFGDLTQALSLLAATSNGSRGVFGGGSISGAVTDGVGVNTIDYITIATTGNATDFGDLTEVRRGPTATSNGPRGVFGGGFTTARVNTIDYITIATTGNATDFGDLTEARETLTATSGG